MGRNGMAELKKGEREKSEESETEEDGVEKSGDIYGRGRRE